ncbi:hypothetical protein E5288_WYG005818 [Bos mutus]|uniref:Uncharacterized protein n=1 Tax=Bos mutus TaxID=72004 RepID=A0A6B0R0N5_9CETA|nr:hypothetical protein [Bos mutus]
MTKWNSDVLKCGCKLTASSPVAPERSGSSAAAAEGAWLFPFAQKPECPQVSWAQHPSPSACAPIPSHGPK